MTATNVPATAQGDRKRELTPAERKLVNLNNRLTRGGYVESLRAVLPRQVSPDAWARTVILAVAKNPKLLNCTEESIAQAALQIAVWQLEIGRTAYIVPYGDKAQAQVDYKGMIELAIRGKAITSCRAQIIYQRDEFYVERGLHEKLVHVPTWNDAERGDPIGAYAVVRFPSGDQLFDLMSKADIERIRDRYSISYKHAKADSPWTKEPLEQWRKTVTRRLLKYVPQNPLLAQVLAYDEDEAAVTDAEIMGRLHPQRGALSHRAVGHGEGYGEDPALSPGEPEVGQLTAGDPNAKDAAEPEVKREVVRMEEKPPVPPAPQTPDTYSSTERPSRGRGRSA